MGDTKENAIGIFLFLSLSCPPTLPDLCSIFYVSLWKFLLPPSTSSSSVISHVSISLICQPGI